VYKQCMKEGFLRPVRTWLPHRKMMRKLDDKVEKCQPYH
jgi:hypothetical protein